MYTNETSADHRRQFLSQMLTGAAALGLGTLLPTAANAKKMFKPTNAGEAEKWLKNIKGSHKIVLDGTQEHEGYPFIWSYVFLQTNNATGTPDNDMTAVVVLRHDAIGFAMNDDMWKRYKFGEMFKVNDNFTKKPALHNKYYHPKEGELMIPDFSIDNLQKRGVMFCVCEMAITVYSSILAKQIGGDAAAIKADWMGSILPGIQIVPSGIWALTRAQENGCAYVFAS